MALNATRKRMLRRILRVFAAIFGVFLLAWLGLAWYINVHKEEIRARITETIGGHLGGELRIGSMEPSLFRGFPDISLSLNDVSLRDSLWSVHRHSLLEAKQVYVRVNPFALLSRRTEIKKITAAHGSIFIYTDSASYSNKYLLSRKDSSEKSTTALIKRFGLEDMHLWFVHVAKQKLFHFYFRELDGRSSKSNGVMALQVAADAHIHEFNFNVSRGSYMHEQPLNLDISLRYHLEEKRLEVPDQAIRIGGNKVNFGGNFYFNQSPAGFVLRLHTPAIPYRTAVSWMSPNIRKILDSFDFAKPLSLDVRIGGEMKYRNIPKVSLSYKVRDNTFTTPYGNIENISYDGSYINEDQPGGGHGDNNSRIALYRLKGSWQDIPFQSDTIAVSNLTRPVVKARIRSSFAIPAINAITGGSVMLFDKGRATADLRYDGGILPNDTTAHTINGQVRISDAGFTYQPRNLAFTDVGATLLFQGDNLFFRNITMRSNKSTVRMEGEALHFLRFYFSDPGKVSVNWKVRGPMVNLNDFISFVGKRRSVSQRRPVSGKISRFSAQLDRVLAASSISMDAQLDKMVYKSFIADDVIARATIAQSGIVVQQVQVDNGGGSLIIRGTVNQSAPGNPFTMNAVARNVDVAGLFNSFDNFGQTAIRAENLGGRVTAEANVRGNVTENGTIIKNSLFGNVTFDMKEGQIRRFAPFEKIARFAFKKRNLSDVTVKDLKGRLNIEGNKIFIPPMQVQTSAVNMTVQGVYGLQGGTDIYMEVPLRNPEKEEARTPAGMLLRTGKGFVLHLRAQDPDGSGVKIGWDPRRRGRKATEEKLNGRTD